MPNIRLPIDCDERVINKHRKVDVVTGVVQGDAVLDALGHALQSARQTGEHLVHAHTAIMADPTSTDAARALKVKKLANAQAMKVAARLDEARRRTLAEIDAIKLSMLPQQPTSPSDIALAAEIRSRFVLRVQQSRVAALAQKDPNAAPAQQDLKSHKDVLIEAIKSGNERFVSAVLGADTFLTELSEAERTRYLHEWNRRRHPDQVDRAKRLQDALVALDRGGKSFVGLIRELTSNPLAEIAEQKAEAAANAAKAAELGQ